MKTKLIAIVGPTASGKSALAVKVAKEYNGEIISADSMQVYKEMNIATAKPTEEEKQGIKHHLIDFLDIDKSYSVGQFVIDAKKAINEVSAEGKLPVLCGGTGLYVDSLINNIEFVENSSDSAIRSELQKLCDERGIDYLLDILREFDVESAERLSDEINPKRIIRAIEFYRTTGTTISDQIKNSKLNESEYESLVIGLTAKDRHYIYDRINRRVDIMLENGLLEEAKSMLNSDLSETASKAIGYQQFKPYFDGESDLDSCVEKLKTETRRYAKRQLTWFRRNDIIHWINIDEYCSAEEQFDVINSTIRGFIYG